MARVVDRSGGAEDEPEGHYYAYLGPPVAITQPRPLCFAAVYLFIYFFIRREISGNFDI